MRAFVITAWRHDWSFHRFVRVAPFAAAAAHAALQELFGSAVARPAEIAGVSATDIDYFNAEAALQEFIAAQHGPGGQPVQPAVTGPVPDRVLH